MESTAQTLALATTTSSGGAAAGAVCSKVVGVLTGALELDGPTFTAMAASLLIRNLHAAWRGVVWRGVITVVCPRQQRKRGTRQVHGEGAQHGAQRGCTARGASKRAASGARGKNNEVRSEGRRKRNSKGAQHKAH